MKKINLIAVMLTLCVSALATDGINFETSKWSEIKAKAAREHKMIFLDAFASWCGPCKRMERDIYTDQKVADYFNANFINVKIDMEAGEGPELAETYNVTSYPTFLFFSPEGKLVHKRIGAMEAEAFISLGREASLPDRQYFTLKEKAASLQLSEEAFSRWAKMASEFEDGDKDSIIYAYLDAKNDILSSKDLTTALLYYTSLKEDRIAFIFRNRARVSSVMGWDKEAAGSELYRILFSFGARAYDASNRSVDSFLAVFRRYDPASLETARMELLYKVDMYVNKDYAAGMNKLISYLSNSKQQVPLDKIANWFFAGASEFEKADLNKWIQALTSFRFRPADKGKEYNLYLMQVITWVNLSNEAKAKEAAQKAYSHPAIPEEYKSYLKENFEVK